MTMELLRARLALALTPGISPKQYHEIVEHYPDVNAFIAEKPECLAELTLNWREADRSLGWAEAHSDHYLLAHDADAYPARLKEIGVPPPFIFVMGQCETLQRSQVAIVGSRKATSNGMECAYDIAEGLATQGFVVTSGMARGIDTRAHEGALKHGETVAVFGTGIDVTYPKSNVTLREKIIENGAIVSEFPLNTGPAAQHFPRRNRLISGMSLGVVVIEAQAKSGSLITARYALEQNREVMALPGLAGDPRHCGCHKLIKQGAVLVESAEDIIETLGFAEQLKAKTTKATTKKDTKGANQLSKEQEQVLEAVDFKLTAIDTIQKRSNMDIKYCLTALSELAWLQLVEQVDGGFIKRKDF